MVSHSATCQHPPSADVTIPPQIAVAFLLSTFINKSQSATTAGFVVFIIGFITQVALVSAHACEQKYQKKYSLKTITRSTHPPLHRKTRPKLFVEARTQKRLSKRWHVKHVLFQSFEVNPTTRNYNSLLTSLLRRSTMRTSHSIASNLEASGLQKWHGPKRGNHGWDSKHLNGPKKISNICLIRNIQHFDICTHVYTRTRTCSYVWVVFYLDAITHAITHGHSFLHTHPTVHHLFPKVYESMHRSYTIVSGGGGWGAAGRHIWVPLQLHF